MSGGLYADQYAGCGGNTVIHDGSTVTIITAAEQGPRGIKGEQGIPGDPGAPQEFQSFAMTAARLASKSVTLNFPIAVGSTPLVFVRNGGLIMPYNDYSFIGGSPVISWNIPSSDLDDILTLSDALLVYYQPQP